MRITFHGAARNVTGSCHLVECQGKRILIDCGLYQGNKEMAEENRRIAVFHAGTKKEGERFVTDGGRVLGVTATDKDLASAMMLAYEAVNKIHFNGMHCRRDIGAKGLSVNARTSN